MYVIFKCDLFHNAFGFTFQVINFNTLYVLQKLQIMLYERMSVSIFILNIFVVHVMG